MNITYKIIDNLDDCKSIWDQLSTIKTIYDEWEFRIAFLGKNSIRFKIALDNDNPVALMPLQFNSQKDSLEFFGGNFMENNRIYVKESYDFLRKDLIESINDKVILRCIMPEDTYIETLPVDDYTFKLNIETLENLNSYFAIFNSKHRANIKKSFERVDELNPEVVYNIKEHVTNLIDLNKKKHMEESLFNDPDIHDAFFKLLDSKFEIIIQSISHQGIIQSVTFSIAHNNTFYVLMAGSNRDFVSGIGTYEKLKSFEYAINNKYKYIDFARADCNWKESWKLEKYPLYLFQKS